MSRAAEKPTLPQHDSARQQEQRRRQLEQTQQKYVFTTEVSTLPGVPLATKVPFNDEPTLEWLGLTAKVAVAIGINQVAVKCSGGLKSASALGGSTDEAAEDLGRLREIDASIDGILKRHLHRDAGVFDKLAGAVEDNLLDPVQQMKDHLEEIKGLREKHAPGTSNVVSLNTYDALFQTLALPPIASSFMDDNTFAELRVGGPNSVLIQGIRALPTKFPVTAEQYRKVMGEGDDLARALAEGRIYLLDYVELTSLDPGTWQGIPKYPYAPLALFAVPVGGRALTPVAIQCGQDPAEHPIFLPAGDGPAGWGWQMAKTVVQVAEGNYHELFVHLARTHLVIEAFAVATHRCLAEDHPIWALLVPHFEGTLFINNAAASSLIAAGGPIDLIFAGTIRSTQAVSAKDRLAFDFYGKMLPSELAARNVADPDKLPEYPYRDDALLVWNAIRGWAEQYVRIYYNTDDDVRNDYELAAWAESIVSDGAMKGFRPILTRDQLIEVCTMVMFTASAQHAAVNFPQKDDMSFAPAITGAGWAPAPKQQEGHDKPGWLALMPPVTLAMQQLDTLYLLGSVQYRPLGDYRSSDLPYLPWFRDPAVTDNALPRFQRALAEIESIIDARNGFRRWEYTYLKPSLIPTSINI